MEELSDFLMLVWRKNGSSENQRKPLDMAL